MKAKKFAFKYKIEGIMVCADKQSRDAYIKYIKRSLYPVLDKEKTINYKQTTKKVRIE